MVRVPMQLAVTGGGREWSSTPASASDILSAWATARAASSVRRLASQLARTASRP
jgi:hypothetical protein